MRSTCFDMLTISGVYIDVEFDLDIESLSEEVKSNGGSKHDTRFAFGLGGPGANGAAVATANKLPAGLIAAQAAGASDWCKLLAHSYGLETMLLERVGKDPSFSAILTNGNPGEKAIFSQRAEPIKTHELTNEMWEAVRGAKVLIVGPLPASDETCDLLVNLAEASSGFTALIPHRSLLASPRFADIAGRYTYLQQNAHEARTLFEFEDFHSVASRFKDLLGHRCQIAITNSNAPGWLWDTKTMQEIVPVPVELVNSVGAGDAFCAAYAVSQAIFGATAKEANCYAAQVASEIVSKQPNERRVSAYSKYHPTPTTGSGNSARRKNEVMELRRKLLLAKLRCRFRELRRRLATK